MNRLIPINIRNLLKKKLSDTQTRLLLILLVPLVFIVLIVGFSSYFTSKNILQKELNEPQNQMLHINMNYIDEFLMDANQIAVNLTLDNNVFRFMTEHNEKPYDNVKTIYNKLETISRNSSFIHSIYIYNMEEDSFVSIPQGFSSSSVTFNDSEWIGIVDEFQDRQVMVTYRDLPNGAKYRGSNISLFRKVKIKGKTEGLIAINFNRSELFSKLTSLNDTPSNSMQYILDPNNNVLFMSKNHPFEQETAQFVLDEVSNGNLKNIVYNEKVLLANKIESNFAGWKYVSVVSQESILANSKTIRNVIFIVSFIALIIGIIAIFFIHSVELKPIRRMRALFSGDDNEPHNRELTHLEKMIDDLVSDHANLSRLTKKVKIEAKSKFIYDIYMGKSSSKADQTEKWQTYFEDWNTEPIHLAIISIDHYLSWKENIPDNYRTVVKSGMANIINEVLSTHFHVETVDLGVGKMVVVIQHKEGKVNLANHLKIAVTNVKEILGFSVSIGINEEGVAVSDLQHAIKIAKETLHYRLYEGYGKVHYKWDQSKEKLYPTKNVQSLIESISTTDPMHSIETIASLFNTMSDKPMDPTLSAYMIEQVRKKIFIDDEYQDLNTDKPTLEELLTMKLEDIADVFKERLSENIEKLKKFQDSKRFRKCKEMIQYMHTHIGEPVGIPEIADSVGISVSLASQWFKEEIDDTIYGYFSRLRMERATELLIETDKKIADIAVEVGYQHENSFIRKFREYKAMSPGKFRKLNIGLTKDNKGGNRFESETNSDEA